MMITREKIHLRYTYMYTVYQYCIVLMQVTYWKAFVVLGVVLIVVTFSLNT